MTKKALVILPAIALIVVGIYFIIATSPFVRYWVDDFCTAATLNKIGFWNTQISTWNAWTGRYSATATIALFELIGPSVVKILPAILLALLVLSAIPLFSSNIIFAFLFIIIILINSPNIIQSFYWQTGSLNYTVPFIFLNLFLACLVFKRRKYFISLAFMLMFIAGGFSESFALAMAVFLFFVILGILIINPKEKKKYIIIAGAGLLGVLVSLVIMSIAPGNAIRGLFVTKPESIAFVIKSTLLTTKWYLLRFLSIKTFLASLVVILSATIFFSKKYILSLKKIIMLMMGSILTTVFVIAAVIGSGFYSMSIIPPERTLSIVTYMILFCFFIFSVLLNSLLNKYLNKRALSNVFWLVVALNLVFSGLIIASIWKNWSKVRLDISTYAVTWDREVKNLPEIKNINAVGGLDNFTDNKGWVASCLADYYGYGSVKITP